MAKKCSKGLTQQWVNQSLVFWENEFSIDLFQLRVFCFHAYPGWALIDIQSFSALIQRFLRFQRCSELNQPTLILTSLVITNSVMNISEHLWFSAEHYCQAANRQRPWKKPTKILMLKRREIENFRITFNGLFWKILKMWFFRNLYFLLIPSQKTSY